MRCTTQKSAEKNPRKSTTAAGVGLVSLLALGACGSAEEPGDPADTETVTETASPEADGEEAEGQPDEETDPPPDQEAETPEGAERLPDEDLPAEQDDAARYYAEEGVEVGVAGLDPEEEPVTVHPEPDHDAEVLYELGPLDAATLAGREVNILDDVGHDSPPTRWAEIELGEGYGWVTLEHLYFFGETEDITEDFDDVPPAEDPQEIAEGVGERAADTGEDIAGPDGEPAGPDWTLVSTPEETGEEFYRVDSLGTMGDSNAGGRFFITVEAQGDGYQLQQVERTHICYRGVTDDGLCV